MVCSLWQAPAERPHLQYNEVHIWRASLNLPEAQLLMLGETLSRDELRRGDKYYFKQDRQHFIAARGILRNILSRYLQVNPVEIEFSYTPHGKPLLSHLIDDKGLSFNLSHANDLVLCALALNRKTGVDLEYIRQDFEWRDIAERFFSSEEKSELQLISENIRCKKFYTYWTRKEAFLKSIGTGLAVDPKNINVTKQSGQSVWVMQPIQFTGTPEQCSLFDLDPGFGYAAALAVEGKGFKIKCWQW